MGADFTNALLDKSTDGFVQVCGWCQRSYCADTRKSLGCGSRRRFKESSPSSPEGPQVAENEKQAFRIVYAYLQAVSVDLCISCSP
eukprot:jgi/Botrbrau1/5700/Bobra.0071s0033.1